MNLLFARRNALPQFFFVCLLLLLFIALNAAHSFAQERHRSLAVNSSASSAPTATPREFGRTVVLAIGGVSWSDWLALASQGSTATPGFRRVLEEGALGAAYLPNGEISQDGKGVGSARVSDAMLRAAFQLSGGDVRNGSPLPFSTALTLGLREAAGASTPGYEEGAASIAFARRTDRVARPGNLVNLGWGQLVQTAANNTDGLRKDESRSSPLGALAQAMHRAGGKTATLGSGDIAVSLQASTPLREWSLLACDGNGVVDAGDVSARLLARDKAAPFGLRANRKAVLRTLDGLFRNGQTGLVAVEWGDTRRAQEYSRYCVPEVAAAYRQTALRSADAFVQALVGDAGTPAGRLNTARDRLVIVVIPDLHSRVAQWLPVVYWRPNRGGQGALLERTRSSEGAGAIGLENLYVRLVSPLNVVGASTLPPSVRESGGPQSATRRISKLIALQNGLHWLQSARPFAHALWCTLFIGACFWTLWALRSPARVGISTTAQLWWRAAMIFPWLLWLAGLCVETTWRFGVAEMNWKLWLALLLVAGLILFLIGATFNWFRQAHLQRTRIGVFWLLLTVVGLKVGGFVMPWNALLRLVPAESADAAARAGELWSLLLISATLLAISGLSRTRHILEVAPSNQEARRVLNLRPTLIWVIAIVALLWASAWGGDTVMAVLALLAGGAMWLRMWLERAPRETRLLHRRIVFSTIAVGVLLLWQRGAMGDWAGSFAVWQEAWLRTWSALWWDAALGALLMLVFVFVFGGAREILRAYLSSRYSLRAMLGAVSLASVVGLVIYGPAAPSLLATFTLGAIAHELLGELRKTHL
jgi:hypothetical protein